MVTTVNDGGITNSVCSNEDLQDLSSATLPEYQLITRETIDQSLSELSPVEQQVLSVSFAGLDTERFVEKNEIVIHPASNALILQGVLRSLMYKK